MLVVYRQLFSLTTVQVLRFSVNILISSPAEGSFYISVVYGPNDESLKDPFLTELSVVYALLPGPWLIIGDFNMISSAADKNNANLNQWPIARFCCFISTHELKDVHLFGRRYT